MTQPTQIATSIPIVNRPMTITHSESRPRYATNVDAITTGFTIGAASMNVTAAAGARPLRASRRATGTDPHSHTGNAIPAIAAAGSWTARGSVASFANVEAGTKTSISAETSAPRATNGMASINSDPNTMKRFRSHATWVGCANRAATATATSDATTTSHVRSGVSVVGVGSR